MSSVGRRVLGVGALAGVVKIAGAALTYAMFIAVAVATDSETFGWFSLIYSAASLVSFLASVGQQSVILRFWPQYAAQGDSATAGAILRLSTGVAMVGCIVGWVVTTVVVVFLMGLQGVDKIAPIVAVVAGALAATMAWAEYLSGATRAQGKVLSAILPRDIAWRVLVLGCMAFSVLGGFRLDLLGALSVTLITLVAAIALQAAAIIAASARHRATVLEPAIVAEFRHVTLGLWGVTSLPPALGQLSTVLVGAILGTGAAALYFIAERTARLLVVALTGLNQVLAPEISAAYYGGARHQVRRLCALVSLVSTACAAAMMAVFLVLGEPMMGVFGEEFANDQGKTVLLILGAAQALSAATGPTGLLLQMAGLQHQFLRLIVLVNVVGLPLLCLCAYAAGSEGAAWANLLTLTTWSWLAVRIATKSLRFDPSILGWFRRNGAASL